MTVELYKYLPLRSGTIRCIRISPSNSDDDELEIEVRHFRLRAKHTVFDALSYTWGPPTVQHFIRLARDRSRMSVRDNCYRFLRHWRRNAPDLSRWIWIDAICIDQSANEEKSEQVRQMHQIYGSARQVLIWLGSASEETTFPEFLKQHPEFLEDRSRYEDEGVPHSLHRLVSATWSLDELRSQQHHLALSHLRSIVAADYWTRRWILQELTSARSHCVILGTELYSACDMLFVDDLTHCMSDLMTESSDDPIKYHTDRWDCTDMWMILLTLEDFHESLCASSCALHVLPIWNLSKEQTETPEKISLVEALRRFRRQKCGDLRDKIYSLLSLTESGQHFKIDYACSVQELFIRTLTHVSMDHAQGGDITGFVMDNDARVLYQALFEDSEHPFDISSSSPISGSRVDFSNRCYNIMFEAYMMFKPKSIENETHWEGHYRDQSCCEESTDPVHIRVRFKYPDGCQPLETLWMLSLGAGIRNMFLGLDANDKLREYLYCDKFLRDSLMDGHAQGSEIFLHHDVNRISDLLISLLGTESLVLQSFQNDWEEHSRGLKVSISASEICALFKMTDDVFHISYQAPNK